MNLFYGTTFEEHVTAFKKDLKEIAKQYNYNFDRKKIYIAYGQPEHVGNCILVINPPLKDWPPFRDKYSNYLFQNASDFKLNNIVLTSCFLIPLEKVSKNDIKAFNPMMEQLVEIFRPKLVVALGEDAQFSFVKKKYILRDYHGQIIAKTRNGIDVVLSYPMNYFMEKSEYEDPSYKEFVRKADWTIISQLYKDRIR